MTIDKKKKISAEEFLNSSKVIQWALLILVMAVFALIMYPNLISEKHVYNLGDVAERDVKSPGDFLIEDKESTELKRKKAVDDVLTVYDHDPTLAQKIAQQVQGAFEDIRQMIEADKENHLKGLDQPSENEPDQPAQPKVPLKDKIWQAKPEFEKKIGFTVNTGAYSLLEKEAFSKEITDMIIRILSEIMEIGVVSNKEILMRETDKGIIVRTIGTKSERIVYNLKSFYGLDQAKTMVRIIGQPMLRDLSYTLISLIVDFTQRLIQPNITLNRNETEERKKTAAEEIKPIFYKIKAGEMLLREGERVTEVQLLKLTTFYSQKRQEQIIEKSAGAVLMIFCLIYIQYVIHIRQTRWAEKNVNKNLLFICTVLILFLIIPKVSFLLFNSLTSKASLSGLSFAFGIPLAASTMVICLFLGFELAIPFAVILSTCTAVIFQNQMEIFIYFFLSLSMAAFWIKKCRDQKVFIRAGLKIGILNILLTTAIDVYWGNFSTTPFLWTWTFAFLGGITSGILTAGLVPFFELMFRYSTDITLMELANLEQPLLRNLMLQAPGTYHHSIIVGSMVEAAASEIGANPLLAKVCGYYHDIGKVNKPLYFIENQTNCPNRHDKLAPSMSSLILISHVKEGEEIGKKNRLGQEITDTIRQHHGTSLIRYFYEKAKQIKGEENVNIDNYRYPGPKPQTREAGLVMLADVVEAASRTLENPTPSRIQGHVQKLINAVFSDGQLDECELTLKDLHNIAKSFNKILNGIHHHRIEYLQNNPTAEGKEKKEKNGKVEILPIKPKSETKATGNESGQLKRLGVA